MQRINDNHDVTDIPLVVDLDHTLIHADLLYESILQRMVSRPLKAMVGVMKKMHDRPALKRYFAEAGALDVEFLPYNKDVLDYIARAKSSGRKIYLASASDAQLVEKVAEHLGLFDGYYGSQEGVNLGGETKARFLSERFGDAGFDYIGDSAKDIPVWRKARKAIVVNASGSFFAWLEPRIPGIECLGRGPARLRSYISMLRVHQWLKNILLFLPPLGAHAFNVSLPVALVMFLSFSFCASSVYVVNDLADLPNDRRHPRKQRRPFASGAIPIVTGLLLAPLMVIIPLILAYILSPAFFAALLAYYLLSFAYSFWLKKRMMVDVLTLACLYCMRIVAGSAAFSVPLSPWMTAFCVFIFLCLALVKRCTELVAAGDTALKLSGRDYYTKDLPMLSAMAAASGFVAVLVFDLYINTAKVAMLYHRPYLLWLDSIILLGWLGRILLLTQRGQMHDDTVLFAMTDRISLLTLAVAGLVVIASI